MIPMLPYLLNPGKMTLADLRKILRSPVQVSLAPAAYREIQRAAQVVEDIIKRKEHVYGINTGFGLLANVTIDDTQLTELQNHLVLSHAAGTGEPLADHIVRLIMVLKVNALAQGYSGVRAEIVDTLLAFINQEIYPCIPSQGSVGASGDLAPLAHMSIALMGLGDVRVNGKILPAKDALAQAKINKIHLAPKEGLALLNGTQVSTALALAGLFQAEDIFTAAIITGALSVDAAKGSDVPFDQRIHAVRGHQGQIDVAGYFRQLLKGSQIRQSHLNCKRVQDPYSLRCQPQVMGACLDNMRFVANTLEIEANAVTDNPLVFSDDQQVLSGGNFHAEPVAIGADNLAVCIAEIGALAERRIALLIDSHLSELPPFLVQDGGLNSGFMMAQVTAAALASENKSLAHPASVDSIPTSANQEDHVSMATFAARRLQNMCHNSATIVGIELLAACQGIDFRAPLKSSLPLMTVHALLRQQVPKYTEDRYFSPDINVAKFLVESEQLLQFLPPGCFASLL